MLRARSRGFLANRTITIAMGVLILIILALRVFVAMTGILALRRGAGVRPKAF